MAGPGARLEKAGTIFSRIRGLLRSRALKDSEKPLWYEVYAAFPPRIEPSYERSEPSNQVQSILYREDFVRAKFYKTYGNPDIIDMRNHRAPTVSQKFIDQYFEIQKSGAPENLSIFEAAGEALKSEGVKLKTLEEIAADKRAMVAQRIEEAQLRESEAARMEAAARSAKPESEEGDDTLDEDLISPDYDALLKRDKPID